MRRCCLDRAEPDVAIKIVVKTPLPFAESGSLDRACAVPFIVLKDQGRADDTAAKEAVASRVDAVQQAEQRVTENLAKIVEAANALQESSAGSFDGVPTHKPGDAASEAMVCVCVCTVLCFCFYWFGLYVSIIRFWT